MKRILSIILSMVFVGALSTTVFTNQSEPNKIKVGINAEFKPFEYYDENGELTGFDVDLMNYIGERIGAQIEYKDMSFGELIPAVTKGEVDCAISAISVTDERDRVIDYSREYLKTDIVTSENGELSRKRGEYYAIVFKEGLSHSPYKDLPNPTDDEALYIMIDEALRELSQDRTVMKLIEKYELNEMADLEEGEIIEYSSIMGGGDPANTENDQEKQASATSVPCSDWAKEDIKKAQALNIINAGGNYNFPAPITREEFCELIYNYCYNVIKAVDVAKGENKFTDTDNSAVISLNAMGIINGKSETEFAPDDLLTREEAAAILHRMINKTKPVPVTEMYFAFDDEAKISKWASESIQVMCNMGVMKGVGNNQFNPKGRYTVEQAIATLVRVFMGSGNGSSDNMTFSDKLKAQMPTDTNYMFSPLSIKMAFAMAANGAEGNTKEEILNALGIEDLEEYNEYSKKLIEGYQKADILKLDIANALWLNKSNTDQRFSESYQNTLRAYYDAEVNSSTKEKIAGEINGWVKEKTNDKIDSIITDELARDEKFIMALLNAVYFKAAWQNEFDEKATKKDTFTDRNGSEKQTDFMNETAYYGYYNNNGVEVLSLPYKNRVYDEEAEKMLSYDFDVSMYLIRGEYSENTLSGLIDDGSLISKRIKLSIPKFESEFDTSLIDIMNNLGVVDAFNPEKAEFAKMFNKGNMYLMAALHKTYIKVDEKGTEAAAVTALAGGVSSAPPPPIVVKFDTPFTYVIRDDANGEILFMGEYAFVE